MYDTNLVKLPGPKVCWSDTEDDGYDSVGTKDSGYTSSKKSSVIDRYEVPGRLFDLYNPGGKTSTV